MFFTSWTTLVWLTVLVVVSWAVYYAVRPLTLNAALVQYATVLGTLFDVSELRLIPGTPSDIIRAASHEAIPGLGIA